MKKLSFISMLFAVAAMAFSCAKVEETPEDVVSGKDLVTVYFGVDNPQTKATIGTTDDKSFTSSWEDGDEVVIDYYCTAADIADQATAKWDASKNAFGFQLTEAELSSLKSTPRDWEYETTFGTRDWSGERTQVGNKYNSLYDVMKGSLNLDQEIFGMDGENPIVIPMERKTAIAYFHLTASSLSISEPITKATLTVDDKSVISASDVKIDNNGSLVADNGGTNTIVLNLQNGPAINSESGVQLWFNLIPEAVNSMTLTIESENYSCTLSNSTATEYEEDHLYKAVGNVAGKWQRKTPVTREVTKTYTFNSKSWTATDESGVAANWTGSKDGNQFSDSSSPIGVQVLTSLSGLTVTSPISYTNVKEVTVVYSSSSKGVGTIKVSVGDSEVGTKSISKSQSKVKLVYTPSESLNGKVILTNTCTTNSFALYSVSVTYDEIQGSTGGDEDDEDSIENTAETAYSTSEAKALIDAGSSQLSTTEVYVKGTISKIDSFNSNYGSITYWLDNDAFEIFGGLSTEGAKFSSADDLLVGDEVVVKGFIKKYNSIYEMDKNNVLISRKSKTLSSISVSGTPTKTTYSAGDVFEPAGLVVTATYSDGTTASLTSGISWTFNPATLPAGATSCQVTATVGDISSEAYTVNGLTVKAPVTLSSVEVSGTPTKMNYYAGDPFSTVGLTVKAKYSDGSETEITEGIEWTINPDPLTAGTTSCTVTAKYDGVTSAEFEVTGLTVIPTITVKKESFASGDNSGSHYFTSTNTDLTFEALQGNSGTAPAINSNCLRLYQNGGYVKISGIKGVKIQSVIITTGSTYDSTIVGYCVDDNDAPTTGESVDKNSAYTISNLNNQTVEIYCLATDNKKRLDIASLEVKYLKETVTLSSIAISGNYETSFIKNSEFNHDNAVVTATFSDGDKQDVTSSAVFSEPDMTTTGSKDVMVSYTYEGVTETTSYSISVEDEVVESLAISGVYTRVFKTSDTFNHEGVVVKATYNSGRTEDISVSAQYSTPDLTTTGEKVVTVSFGGKSETYTIKVIPSNSIFFESFDKNDGTGGNDNKWSGSIAANNIVCDNTGWTMTSAKGANACAKFGTGSAAGSAKTPSILVSGDIVLTFKAAAWNGNTEVTGLSVSATSGTVDTTSVTMAKAAWTEYSITITGVETSTQITIAASQSSNNRFFLDEVLVTKVETSAASAK